MVNLASISQALVVAEHLSFSRAARVLGVRQSAVSRRVRALENELGVSLFERAVNGVRLTDAGRRFLERSRSVLAEIDYAVKGAGNAGCGAEGSIRIGILGSLSGGFPRALVRAYRERHPAIVIDVVEGSTGEHLADLGEHGLDIAFIPGTILAPHCDTAVLRQSWVFAVLPESHRLANEERLAWKALKDERFIVGRDATGQSIHDCIVHRLADFGGTPAVERYEVGRETLMHLVALGFGISLIGDTGIATRYPEVVFRPLEGAADVLPYSAVWLPGNDNPALRRLLSLARLLASAPPARGPPQTAH